MKLVCTVCESQFDRPGRHGPVPRYCSPECKRRVPGRQVARSEYGRRYHQEVFLRDAGMIAAQKDYMRGYYQRPEVKEREVARWRELFGDRYPGLELPAPYSGHPWMDRIREMVGYVSPDSPHSEYLWDLIGEGVLAFLEGRDPQGAMDAYKKQEYIPRFRTIHLSEWKYKDDPDKLLPAPSLYNPPVVLTDSKPAATIRRVRWHKDKRMGLHAEARSGGKGPNRSAQKFSKVRDRKQERGIREAKGA